MTAIVRRGGYDGLVDVLGPVIEVALEMVAFADDRREVVGLHALGPRIPRLVALGVAISDRLQADRRARLLERPGTAGDHGLRWSAIRDPVHGGLGCAGRQRRSGGQQP